MPEKKMITTFSGGELSPKTLGRPDLEIYSKGLRTCENFLPFVQGGLQTRPGTIHVEETKDSSVRSRLIPFKFGTTDSYALEFGDGAVRVHQNNAGTHEIIGGKAWDVSTAAFKRSSVSFNHIGSPEIVGFAFSVDGTQVYTTYWTGSAIEIRQYTCSTAWDVSVLAFQGSYAVGIARNTAGLFFKADGTKLYTIANGVIYQHTLSTPWDITTASYDSVTGDISAQLGTTEGDIFMTSDGTKLYAAIRVASLIYQYTLSTPWDISTIVYANKSINPSETSSIGGFFFKPDGLKMYTVGRVNDSIYQYTLSTAWDVSTATYASKSFDVSNQITSPVGLFFEPDGTNLFCVNSTPAGEDVIYQVTMSIDSPYAVADLLDIQYAQSNDILYLAHPSYPPQKLIRATGNNWQIAPLNFIPPPTQNLKETSLASLTLSALTGDNITVTTDLATFIGASDVGKVITGGTGRLAITDYISTTEVLADIVDDFNSAFFSTGDWYINGSPYAQLTPSAVGPVNSVITLTAATEAFRSGGDSLPTDIDKYVYINDGVCQITNDYNIGTSEYTSKSKDVSAETTVPEDLFFSPDGTKVYKIGHTPATVFQYTLSTAWDISTATYASKSKSVNSEDTEPTGLSFKSDGTIMYIAGFTNKTVYEYTLSTPWDVSTATYSTDSKDISAQETSPRAVFFSVDGTKFYIVGLANKTVYQYTLTSPWRVSSATYSSKSKDVTAEDNTPTGMTISSDGTVMQIAGQTNRIIYQYLLSTPWDMGTATYTTNNFDISSQETNLSGVAIGNDEMNMYIIGKTNDTIYQYSLGGSLAVSAKVLRVLSAATATYAWSLESPIWNATDGYPSSVVFHQDRLVWGGSTGYPQTIALSVVGDYENHERGANDADAMLMTLNAREVNAIEWLMSREDLMVGTTEAEWAIRAANGVLTPTDRSANFQTSYGSKSLRPVVIDGSILFFQRLGRKLRELTYDFNVKGYTAPDISVMSEHITEGGIDEVAYQQSPLSIEWMVRGDGQAVGLSFEKGTQTITWHRHLAGGAFGSGDAVIESFAVTPHPTDDYDELWMIVKRTINSATVRYIEVLTKILDSSDLEDYWQLDSGKLFGPVASTSTITGLAVWEGETLTVVNKTTGVSLGTFVVSGAGEIDLGALEVTDALTGYPYTPTMRPVKIVQNVKHTITEAFIEVLNTRGGQIGSELTKMDDMTYGADADTMFTGTKKQNVKSKIDREGSMYVTQNKPYPMTILTITPAVAGGNA